MVGGAARVGRAVVEIGVGVLPGKKEGTSRRCIGCSTVPASEEDVQVLGLDRVGAVRGVS